MMQRVFPLLFAALILAALPRVQAAETLPGPIQAEVVSVYDGDTFKARAQIWLGHSVVVNVRILGVDTPERRARCPAEAEGAARARAALIEMLSSGEAVLFQVRRGKYAGRVLARVETPDGRDVALELIAAGLGRPYAGEKRRGWCGDDADFR